MSSQLQECSGCLVAIPSLYVPRRAEVEDQVISNGHAAYRFL